MTHLNLTMLEDIGALLGSPKGPSKGAQRHGPSFNYSVRSPQTNNYSLLHLVPPDISQFLSNSSQGAMFALNATYELAGSMAPCNLGNDTSAIGCNYSMGADNTSVDPTVTARIYPYTTLQLIVLALLAGTTCITTIIGNLIVILSFIVERSIRQPTNYFIASLAVSDLLIGTFSMPFYTVYLLTGKYWPLGEVLCDLWLSVDYTVCLTSIYTVFCITIDRFCSVKIPAKYRAWRTDNKVTGVICLTWIIPILVFFTSIFGWQYFVGKRTVPEGMCYVQYMEDALFNCILQLGYFWVTLTVMCILYTGIYKVALDLQRKSEAKQKKMTSLVSMAGQTMTKIGIGMSKHPTSVDSRSLFDKSEQNAHSRSDGTPKTLEPGHSTTSPNSKQVKDDDRSSSPAFPSDTDQSSQSPRPSIHKKEPSKSQHQGAKSKNQKRQAKAKTNTNKKGSRRDRDRVSQELQKGCPGLANSGYTDTVDNDDTRLAKVRNSVGNATHPYDSQPTSPLSNSVKSPVLPDLPKLPCNSVSPTIPLAPLTADSLKAGVQLNQAFDAPQEQTSPSSMENMPSDSPPPYPVAMAKLNSDTCSPKEGEDHTPESEFNFPPPPSITADLNPKQEKKDQIVAEGGQSKSDNHSGRVSENLEDNIPSLDTPDSGLKYIDQDSLKSPLSTDDVKLMAGHTEGSSAELAETNNPKKSSSTLLVEIPGSPIWKRRSLVERETRAGGINNFHSRKGSNPFPEGAENEQISDIKALKSENAKVSSQSSSEHRDSTSANQDSMASCDKGANNNSSGKSTANIQVESHLDNNSRTVSRLAKPDEIQPLNADDGATPNKRKSKLKGGSPLRGLIKSVGSRRFKRNKKEKQQKSKSENRARKALRVITIILGAFVLCWTPWHILSMIIGFCPENQTCVEPILYDISYWLCYLNSPINPFCYAFANQQFKKTFIRILKFDWHRT